MLLYISITSLLLRLIDVTAMIIIVTVLLKKNTYDRIIKYFGVYCVIIGAISLSVVILRSVGVNRVADSILISLLSGTVEIAAGIIIYKSRCKTSVLSFIFALLVCLLAVIKWITDRSFVSVLTLGIPILGVTAMLRQFRTMKRDS